jgi:hypothetical protein
MEGIKYTVGKVLSVKQRKKISGGNWQGSFGIESLVGSLDNKHTIHI